MFKCEKHIFTDSFDSIANLLDVRSERTPDQIAVIFLEFEAHNRLIEQKISYRQLCLESRTRAAYIQKHLEPGDRAVILYQPGVEYIFSFLGCLYAGVTAIPTYVPYSEKLYHTLESIIKDSDPKAILTTLDISEDPVFKRYNEMRSLQLDILVTDRMRGITANDFIPIPLHSEHLAFFQYTSGSTAQPKGVMLTHHNLLHNQYVLHSKFQHSKETVFVSWLPPYHDMGLILGIIQPIFGNFPVIMFSPLDFIQTPFRWLDVISKYKATNSGAPNFAYEYCILKVNADQKKTLDLTNWKLAFNGAETVRAETLERFSRTFKSCGFRSGAFYPCYGLAEATLMVSGGLEKERPVSVCVNTEALTHNKIVLSGECGPDYTQLTGCGTAFEGEKIIIVDKNSKKKAAQNRVGEIWLQSRSVALGYWRNREETEKIFRARITDDMDSGYYLRTGDAGFLHNNELYITGRVKDLIIIKGRNYYPQDIELSVEQTDDRLRKGNIAAFSLDCNDEESLAIVAEVKNGVCLTDESFTVLINFIRSSIATNHGLETNQIILIRQGTIPKTSSGKIRRKICKDQLLNNRLSIISSYPQTTSGIDASNGFNDGESLKTRLPGDEVRLYTAT